jgi:hypothetical protein
VELYRRRYLRDVTVEDAWNDRAAGQHPGA